MQRRTLLCLAGAVGMSLHLPLSAQVTDLNDAINKAGRQRMLSQRMGKAWLSLVHKIEGNPGQPVLEKSMALFERQLAELKSYAPNPEIRDTYTKLEAAWSDYKTVLIGSAPEKSATKALLAADAKVLALAHQGTVQYEAASGKPVGKLVNVAGRQRMLSQRMAKYYMACALQEDADTAKAEIAKARAEFISAQELLRTAPEATLRIKDELDLANSQWVFFDQALQNPQSTNPRTLSDMFYSSENLLSVMDRVTGLYSAIKV